MFGTPYLDARQRVPAACVSLPSTGENWGPFGNLQHYPTHRVRADCRLVNNKWRFD
jgi:hypothetical protein